MTNDQRKYRFIFQLIFTPAIAFMSYFMVAIIVGPLLIDVVGEILFLI